MIISPKATLLTWREKLQCFNATSFNLESLCLSLKMMCWMKDATTRIPCQSDLKQQSMLLKKKKKKKSLIWLITFFSGTSCQTHLMESNSCEQPGLQRELYLWLNARSRHGCKSSTLLTNVSHSCNDVTARSLVCSIHTWRAKMSSICREKENQKHSEQLTEDIARCEENKSQLLLELEHVSLNVTESTKEI